ncbi:hypothetical protein [Halosimplex pelagicum]|uniref:Uncharacterized protein n=1 Tax=Halosimplex pelagicum TaxID=869886 RepID=A0A7D5T5C8_9EURY|nr:hypothetical protein [Halosimplex pelagicum]QLH82268.1 hypothetical protein HZS54_11885 [Halosimplex pelagicum]
MPEAEPESSKSPEETGSNIESDLHPKHRQTLMDTYNKADWLCGTLAENQYIEVPSHLTSIRDSLKGLLTEQGLLEHRFVCTYCGYETWASEKPTTAQKSCPDCEEPLEYASTRIADTDSN